ncbi:MAG: SEC-C metal-binding domain-containing protein, partial [Kofleriaceae bacterium]
DAEASDDDEDDDAGDAPGAPGARRPWQPAPGQAAPAGHVPCPCGSGARYRSCCRDLPRA